MTGSTETPEVLVEALAGDRQAMRDGGRVVLKLKYDSESQMVELMVRDTGKGIPQDQLPHIFDAYYTTKDGPDESGKGGTGLGLSSCREIIESHRGRIRVESSVGVGTAFTIKLPVAMADAKPPAIISASQNLNPTDGARHDGAS